MDESLEAAVNRLAAFRSAHPEGAVIHAASGLSAGDLDMILARLRLVEDVVMIPYVESIEDAIRAGLVPR